MLALKRKLTKFNRKAVWSPVKFYGQSFDFESCYGLAIQAGSVRQAVRVRGPRFERVTRIGRFKNGLKVGAKIKAKKVLVDWFKSRIRKG